jgi:hypothetical protein
MTEAFNSDSDRQDHIREERPPRYMADQGTSKTSHGDGEPTIDEALIERRERDLKEEEEKAEAEEREVEALKGKSSNKGGAQSGAERSAERSGGRSRSARSQQSE